MVNMKRLLWTLPALTLVLAGCSTSAADNNATDSASDDTLKVVTSTQVWADVASAVSPDLDITAIVTNGDSDPHSFEPSAADMARIEEADILIVGGGGYDAWLYDSVGTDDERIVHALELTAGHDHDHGDEHDDHAGHDHAEVDNEHVWYSTEEVSEVAEDFAEKVQELDPAATTDATAVTTKMDELHEKIHALPVVNYAQTEAIADHLLSHSDMVDATPAGYRASTLSHGEPTAVDIAAFQEALKTGKIDILINNPQSAAPVAQELIKIAEENNIPVVEIYETPQSNENFLDAFTKAVDDLTDAATQV